MKELGEQWNRFQKMAFPDNLAGKEIEGEDLVSLDTYAAGCIVTYVGNKGSLDHERRNILKLCIKGLKKVIPKISNEGKVYFQELLSISLSVEGKLK